MRRLLFWRRQRHTIPRWLRMQMLSLRAWTEMTETERRSDNDLGEGRGAFGWVILSTLIVLGIVIGEYSAHVLR